jgi:hydrogenase maturation protease
MKRILVIGIGSLIMRDDAIGSKVVEHIEGDLRTYGIDCFVGETDFQCCFDEIKIDDYLVIIDAMTQGKEPGYIDVMLLCDALKSRCKLRTQHEFSFLDLIELHYPQIEGCFIGIEIAEIGFGFELSKPLQMSFDKICSYVLTMVLNIKKEMEHA